MYTTKKTFHRHLGVLLIGALLLSSYVFAVWGLPGWGWVGWAPRDALVCQNPLALGESCTEARDCERRIPWFPIGGPSESWVCNGDPVDADGSCGDAYTVCTVGSPSWWIDTVCGTPDTWTCEWLWSWNNESCSVPDNCPIDWACSASFWICSSGVVADLNNEQCGGTDTWTCEWQYGWSDDFCSLPDTCENWMCGDGNTAWPIDTCALWIDWTLISWDHYRILDSSWNEITPSLPVQNIDTIWVLQGEVISESVGSVTIETDILLKYDATDAINAWCEFRSWSNSSYTADYSRDNFWYSPNVISAVIFEWFNSWKYWSKTPVWWIRSEVKFYPLLPDGSCDFSQPDSRYNWRVAWCVEFNDPFEVISKTFSLGDWWLPLTMDESVTLWSSHSVGYLWVRYEEEECDDGNAINGDGCSDTCEIEPEFFCTGPIDTNSSICTEHGDDTAWLTSNISRALVPQCTNARKCEYICNEWFERQGTSCVPKFDTYVCDADGARWLSSPLNPCSVEDTLLPSYSPTQSVCANEPPSDSICQWYVCQWWPLVNAVLCPEFPNEWSPDTGGVDFTRVDDCTNASQNTNAIQCQYECAAWHFWDGAKCESTSMFTCDTDWEWNANGNWWSDVDTYTPWDTRRPNLWNASAVVLFDDLVVANSRPSNDRCVPWTCEWVLPDDASLCTPILGETDNIPGSGTQYTNIFSCGSKTPTKCEYQCDLWFQFLDTWTLWDAIGECERQLNEYICDGRTWTWNQLPTKCPESLANTPSNPAAPGDEVCAQTAPTTSCEAWSCGLSVPANATDCGNSSNLPNGSQVYSNINDCDELALQSWPSVTYCNFECNESAGYEYDGVWWCRMKFNTYSCQLDWTWTELSSNSCVNQDTPLSASYTPLATVCRDVAPDDSRCEPYVCQTPPSLPGDTLIYELCGADEEFEVPNDSTNYISISSCSADSATKCEFACINNHVRNGSTCVPEYTSYECLITWDRSAWSTNDCNTVAFQWWTSYSPGSVVCIDPAVGPTPPSDTQCDTNRCIWTVPANWSVCPTDDQWLSIDTTITVVWSAGECVIPPENAEDTKCERYCHEWYTYNWTDCVADYVWYTCDGSGTWVNNGPGCPVYNHTPWSAYTPWDSICTDSPPLSTECVVCQDGETDLGEQCDDNNANDNDSCIVVIESSERVCKDAICGDGFTYGAQFGWTEECDGQTWCTSCTWDVVDCSLWVSSSSIAIWLPVTFTYSTSWPTWMIITPLNFGDNTDSVLSWWSSDYTYTAPWVYTASFAVINPWIQTTVEPLASRVKKVCEATVTVVWWSCGNNQIDIWEACEVINGEVTGCAWGWLCNPFTCGCQNTCDEVIRDLTEECDNGIKCEDFSECTTNSDCNWIGDWLCIEREGDGCTNSCKLESCGDDVYQPKVWDGSNQLHFDLECEYTWPDAAAWCTEACMFAWCGDGITQWPLWESCDPWKICYDGADAPVLVNWNTIRCENNTSICAWWSLFCKVNTEDVTCDESCRFKDFCGDGNIDYGPDGTPRTIDDVEICDEWNDNSQDANCWSRNDALAAWNLALACTITRCGDGHTQENGNGATWDAEQCDDGNSIDTDSCNNLCESNDALIWQCRSNESLSELTVEEILWWWINLNTNLCESWRVVWWIVQVWWVLTWICNVDDWDLNTQAACVLPTCGDGSLDPLETCDDGGVLSWDWCSETCQQEPIISPIGDATPWWATCVEAGAYPIIHDDEYLPFWRQGNKALNFLDWNDCSISWTWGYLWDSAMCYFGVSRFEWLVEVERDNEMVSIFKQPCFDATPWVISTDMIDNPLMIIDLLDDHGVIDAAISNWWDVTVSSVDWLLWVSYLVPGNSALSLTYEDDTSPGDFVPLPTTNEIISRNAWSNAQSKLYGQYEIKLLWIQYDYCAREKIYDTVSITRSCDPWSPGDNGDWTCTLGQQVLTGISNMRTIPMYFDIQNTEPTLTRDRTPSMSLGYTKDSEAICRIPFTISKPYFVQRWTTFQEVANSDLGEIYSLDGTSLSTENTILDSTRTGAGQSSRLWWASRTNSWSVLPGEETAYNYLLTSFSEQYERLAVVWPKSNVSGLGAQLINNTMKLPRENIFFYQWDDDTNPLNDDIDSNDIARLLNHHGVCDSDTTDNNPELCDPFTLVFKRRASRENQTPANLNIQWNLSFNAMYLIDGEINFATDRNDVWWASCDDAFDVVDGILLAKGWFTAEKLRNDDLDQKRCMRGWLQIRGLLFGAGLDQDLFDNRRSAFSSREETLFEWNPIQKAGDLFNTCYMPTLIMRHILGEDAAAWYISVKAPGAIWDTESLFKSWPDFPSYAGTKNNWPVSFPAFRYNTDLNDFQLDMEDANWLAIEYCNIETYPAYRPIIDAMKTKLVDTLYQVCEGDIDAIANASPWNTQSQWWIWSYCGDGIVQPEIGEICDYGDNTYANPTDFKYCTMRCSNWVNLSPKEEANIINLSEEALRMMKLSGMQVDISAVNQQLLMQNLMIRANNYAGIQLDCTAGGTNTRVTRSMIRRVLAERFGDVQKLFITANDSDTADNTVDSYMRWMNYDNSFHQDITYWSSLFWWFRSFISWLWYASETYIDNIFLYANKELLNARSNLNNDLIEAWISFGVSSNMQAFTSNIPGIADFIESLVTVK